MRILVTALVLTGCSSSPADVGDAATENPVSDGAPSDANDASADAASPNDAGAGEAAGEAGGPDRSKALRIANFSSTGPTHLDFCRKRATDPVTAFTTPVLKSLGLPPVPARSISAYFTLPPYGDAGSSIRAIDGDIGDCSQTLRDFNHLSFDGGVIYVWANSPTLVAVAAADAPAATDGQQTFLGFLAGPFNATITFGSTSVTYLPTTAAPGSGALSATFGGGGATFTRPFTATAGGVATIAAFQPDTILVCDDVAPPQGGLTVCN